MNNSCTNAAVFRKKDSMKLNDFKTEQWMNVHEGDAVYNLIDTCISPLTYSELTSLDTDHTLSNLKLDYGEISGSSSFRKKVLSLYQTGTIDNIILSQGCLQANEMVMSGLLNPGDTVITFTPGYQQFTDIPESIGCHVLTIPLHEENNWLPDYKDIEEAMHNPVKMIIINNPANPTGSLFPLNLLNKIIHLARKQNTWILSDEVYRGLTNEPSISDLYVHGIATSSLSKLFSLAGLRLGWVKAETSVIHMLSVRRDYSIISTGPLVDTLGTIALSHKDEILSRSKKIADANKAVIHKWLETEPRCSLVFPETGTVGFLKYNADIPSAVLAEDILHEYGVFFVPGSCFDCEHHLRIGFTNDPKITEKGLQLLSQYLDSHTS